jgi:acetyl esterase/lipase
MKRPLCLVAAFAMLAPWFTNAAPATPALTLSVWPDGRMPGTGATAPVDPKTEQPARSAVTHPEIAVFPAPNTTRLSPAILICPGGGYEHLAYDKEGTEIAQWLNTLGVTGIVLKYRVPKNREGAFQDVQRAMRLVRSHASEWHIDPKHIGVMGFSAGGHLSARLSNNSDTAAYPKIDAADSASCRPDFTVLIYPAYLDAKDGTSVTPEIPVNAKTPPTFIAHTEDDHAYIRGSKAYDAALTKAGVPHEYFLVATGGHGYGLHSTEEIKVWPDHLKAWLQKSGIL